MGRRRDNRPDSLWAGLVCPLRKGRRMNAKILSLSVACIAFAACGIDLVHPTKCGGPGPSATASLSSVTLAQDCGSAAAPAEKADFAAGACLAGTPCPSFCRQSSMQLQFSAFEKSEVSILDVRLIDPKTGQVLERLKSREPQQWSGDAYISWDQVLQPTVVLKASYKLSAPSYNYPGAGDSRFGYASKYTVEVDVLINGELHTVTGEATREPEVVT